MKKNKQISSKQIRALMVTTVIGVGIISLPQKMALILDNDGWIAILLGGLLIIPSIVIVNKIFKLYPGKTVEQIGYEVYGNLIFKLFLIIILIYFIAFLGFMSRHLGEITKAFLLQSTPIEVIIISFIVSTAYISRCNIETIARSAYHIYPFIIGYVILLIVISLQGLDFTNMLPIFQSNIKDIPKGVMASLFSYSGFEILLFAIPFAEEKEKTLKASLSGLAIVILVYLIFFIITLSEFGIYRLKSQSFPSLSIVKEIDLPGYFIENLDILVMGVWILIIFATIASIYYMSGKVAADLFKLENHDLFILPLVPFIYMVSLIPDNMFELNEILGKFIDYMGIMILIVLPVTTYTIGHYKLRRRKE